ncbi:hypothetical protein MPER_12614 [Moniliophthora perniciosa FA553]|nr:hypothetical protein MPER_12614 [Moniliophthora perniciosa FA553]
MSSDIPEEIAELLTVRLTIVYPIASLSAVYFVYGFYALLFGISVYMMCSRQKADRQNNRFYLSLTVALFVLVTTFVIVDTADLVRYTILQFNTVKTGDYLPLLEYLRRDTAKTASYFLIVAIPILLNFTADCMLVCSPLLCDMELTKINRLSAHCNNGQRGRIVIESGVLYPISATAALIVSCNFVNTAPVDLTPIPVFAAGIAPTLIIVRAQLGKNVESLQEAVSDIRFTSRTAPQEGSGSRSQVQVHSVVHFEDQNEEPMNGRKEEILV